jgi:DAK2 domain fusion protein YloV
MQNVLINTPNQLEVLKEAGVVDSGGAGVLLIFQGMLFALNEVQNDLSFVLNNKINSDYLMLHKNDDFGFCTEFIFKVTNHKFNYTKFYDYLTKAGESLVVVKEDDTIKVHIHLLKTDALLKYVKEYGNILSLKIENMAEQNKEVLQKSLKTPFAIVSIAQGDGIIDLFKTLGSDIVINGGQTMNTSTQEILSAFELLNTDNIIIFPNNKNIMLATEQAAKLYTKSKIHIIETVNVVECYFALSMLVKTETDVESVIKQLRKGYLGCDTLLTTQAIRDANVNSVICKKDAYIGLLNNKIVASSFDIFECITNSLKEIELDEKNIGVIFLGQKQKEETAQSIIGYLNEKFPYLEVGLLIGNQDVFDFIIGFI